MSKSDDRSLRFLNEVLGLDRLHYGMWLDSDEVSFEKLKEAQVRYEDYLIDSIPDDVKMILDVGCGTGMLTSRLLEKGYRVEGLSPDINQKQNFLKNIKAPFYHMRFEAFTEVGRFDCIIMSESCQYIKLDKLFAIADRALRDGGYLMICDYFVLENATGPLSKSGHDYNEFMRRLDESAFSIETDRDITPDIAKTLMFGKDFADRVLLGFDLATQRIREKRPLLTKLFKRLFNSKIKKVQDDVALMDADRFCECKTYRFMLLKKR